MKKTRIFFGFLFALLFSSCSLLSRNSEEVTKPRIHKGWYKHHAYHRKIGVGRVRITWFEKQGTKTVRMK
jgi:hypothetical protein